MGLKLILSWHLCIYIYITIQNLIIGVINLLIQKREWCDRQGSVEEIQWRQHHKHAAAIRRERALAYAFYRRARAASKELEFWQMWEQQLGLELELDANKSKVTPEMAHINMNCHSGVISPASKSCVGHEHHQHVIHGTRSSRSRDQSPTKPGYMEGTISMRAKCKSWGSAKFQQTPSPLHKKRHTSMGCMDNHQILLQCN